MNTLRLRRTFFILAVAALAVTAMPLAAAPAIDGPVADVLLGTTQVQWSPRAEYAGLRLTISGPNGTEQFAFGPGESPLLDLASVVADIDGQYSWELRAVPNVDVQQIAAAMRTPGFAGGERQRPAGLPAAEDLVQSGSFRVVGGAIVQPMAEAPAALNVEGAGGGNKVTGDLGFVTAELLHAEDVKIQGSLCVGFDCTNSESFGADTIRLKENNLRIHFNDTSNSASFPTNDWRIEANSSANGGGSYFSIIDVDGGRTPFQIDAGAPTNSLRVDSGGDLGLGVSNPVVELHVADGDSPTLRLEQNNSSGFAAQTWDVAGNETNFFVRDATNGSPLPFRILPGSGNGNALVIANDGDIGMGTASPASPVHIVRSESPGFRLEDNSGTGLSTWEFELNSNGLFQVNKQGSGGAEVLIRERADGTGGQETMDVDGSIEADNFNLSSSRTFKTGFEAVDAAGILAKVAALPVSEWTFKWDKSGTRHIGPMAEDFLATFGVGNDSTNISVGDAAGVALAAIKGLHQELTLKQESLTALQQVNSELRERQVALEAELADLKSLVTSLADQD